MRRVDHRRLHLLSALIALIHVPMAVIGDEGEWEAPRWLIEERRLQYTLYEQCIRRQEQRRAEFGDLQKYNALVFPRGANIHLDCFECIDPLEADAIEDIWKPNDSLDRKFYEFIDIAEVNLHFCCYLMIV